MPRVRQTLADYERLPEHVRADFVGGALVMAPAPSYRHEQLVMAFVETCAARLGPGWGRRVFVSRFEVRAGSGDDAEAAQPDVAVLPKGTRRAKAGERPTPILVAEMLSPSTASHDRGPKLAFYARAGVREAWIVDPEACTIEVHDLASARVRAYAGGDSAVSSAVPGLRVDVRAFFAT
jgi:Uma2 family endonuclease